MFRELKTSKKSQIFKAAVRPVLSKVLTICIINLLILVSPIKANFSLPTFQLTGEHLLLASLEDKYLL